MAIDAVGSAPANWGNWKELVPQAATDMVAVPEVLAQPEVADDSSEELPHLVITVSHNPDENPSTRLAARKLYTSKYLRKHYIEPEDLNSEGLYFDEYDARSVYLYAENGVKDSCVRQIQANKKGGILSLPTAKHFAVDSEKVRLAAGVDSLADLKSDQMVEVSALASDQKEGGVAGEFDATIAIHAAMLREALQQGHKLWLQNTTPRMVAQLRMLIGQDQIHVIGEPKMYLGSVTTPVAINPQDVVRKLLGSEDPMYDFHKGYLREIFRGLDATKVPKDIQELLVANEIPHVVPSKLRQVLSNKDVLAQAGVFAYTMARALPVGHLPGFHGSVEAFWSIDAATSFSYTYGLLQMYKRGVSLGRRALGAALAIPSFVAPYAYLYAEGRQYPNYVNIAVGSMVTGAVAKEVVARKLRSRKESAIRGALEAPKQHEE
jgi:hypothetical protein